MNNEDKHSFYGATDVGKRNINQDAMLIDGTVPYRKIPEKLCIKKSAENHKLQVFAVFDGMGGEKFGEEAALMTAEYIQQSFIKENINCISQGEKYVIEKLAEINRKIREKFDDRAGTTATICLIYNNEYCLMNIGDSPAFHISDSTINEISHRHNRAQALKDEGKPFTLNDEKVLLHCIGIENYFTQEDVHIRRGELKNGEKIVICSDGITDCLQGRELLDAVNSLSAEEIVEIAREKNNADNCTIIIYEYTE